MYLVSGLVHVDHATEIYQAIIGAMVILRMCVLRHCHVSTENRGCQEISKFKIHSEMIDAQSENDRDESPASDGENEW